MNIRRHAITLTASVIVSWAAPSLFAQTKIAVVDLQRALSETEDGRRAKRRLESLFRRRQKALDEAQEKLKKMKTEIERLEKTLRPEKLRERVEAFEKAYVELQSTYVEYQRELAEKEAQLTKRILERMQEIVRRLGQREGYSLVVEANEGGVVWVPSNADLTDRVIQLYNASPARMRASMATQRE